MMSICLSVRLSVTRRYFIETAKRIIKLFSPSGSHTNLFFSAPNGIAIFRRELPPNGASNAGGIKIAIFGQYLAFSQK